MTRYRGRQALIYDSERRIDIMTNNDDNTGGIRAIEEAIASFACEGLYFSDKEKALIHQMEAEGLSVEDRVARVKAYCVENRPK